MFFSILNTCFFHQQKMPFIYTIKNITPIHNPIDHPQISKFDS